MIRLTYFDILQSLHVRLYASHRAAIADYLALRELGRPVFLLTMF